MVGDVILSWGRRVHIILVYTSRDRLDSKDDQPPYSIRSPDYEN